MESVPGGEPKRNWAERLTPAMRVGVTLLLSLALLLLAAVILGLTMGAVAHVGVRHMPPFYLVLAVMVGIVIVIARALRTVIRSWRSPDVSPFDRRYYRMWGVVGALGFASGVGFWVFSDKPHQSGMSLFSNSPIEPGFAIAFAVVGAILLVASTAIYLRTIDDHEERAYLWGSTIAFHFLAIAFPVAWLLSRGGLLAPLDIAQAMIIVLISFAMQAAVWLWFKFR